MTATRILFAVAALAATLEGFASGEQGDGPQIRLTTFFGETSIHHPSGDPLLLRVGLSNPDNALLSASNERNRRVFERFSGSAAFAALPDEEKQRVREEHAERELPRYTLGSKERAVADLVQFRVFDARGEAVSVEVRPLAGTVRTPAPVELYDGGPLFLTYGIDAGVLARLPTGVYAIVAYLDTLDESSMWQGRTVAEPVTLHVTSALRSPTRQESNRRLFAVCGYRLADRDYEETERLARTMIERDPAYIAGWGQLGDALAGQERYDEALEAYAKGLSLHEEILHLEPPPIPEPPLELELHIREIEAERSARPRRP
jgi:tetratricopeptide (TPR) repeat protein